VHPVTSFIKEESVIQRDLFFYFFHLKGLCDWIIVCQRKRPNSVDVGKELRKQVFPFSITFKNFAMGKDLCV
jgi:hypothetical protein